jgi:hypothetical protein
MTLMTMMAEMNLMSLMNPMKAISHKFRPCASLNEVIGTVQKNK